MIQFKARLFLREDASMKNENGQHQIDFDLLNYFDDNIFKDLARIV